MKEYSVRVPFSGFIDLKIAAFYPEEAIEKFWLIELPPSLGDALRDNKIDGYEYEFNAKKITAEEL